MRELLLAIVATLLVAAAPASPVAQVDAASRAFDHAQQIGDRAAIDRFLASDFVFVRGSGVRTGRDAFLASFGSGKLELEPFVIANRRVIGLGRDAGMVSAEGTIRGKEDGVPFVEHFNFADTFLRRDGRWQVVHVQVTPIPAK